MPGMSFLYCQLVAEHVGVITCPASSTSIPPQISDEGVVVRRRMKRCSAVAWNPASMTQLVVACEDDLSPLLQVWDRRDKTMAPVCELLGHAKVRAVNPRHSPPAKGCLHSIPQRPHTSSEHCS